MTTTPSGRQARRAAFASMIGSTIEYYDFFVYGSAASLAFNKLFFPTADPAIGVLLSLSTFAVAFVMRPVGAAIFGHFGDRLGRKRTLFVTITLMGVGTTAIGVLPTYQQIGLAAPILLVLARLVQGLALGGEQGGAWVLSIESTHAGRRGLSGAFVNSGSAWGLLLSNLVLLALSQLPDDAFLSWGWRIPFLLSATLIAVGVYVRLKLEESPEFVQVERTSAVRRAPLVDAVRTSWRQMILVALGALGLGANFYVASVFSLSYSTSSLHLPHSTVPTIILIMTVIVIFAMPLFGALSDRIGRKPVFLASAAAFVVSPFVWFLLFQTRNYGLMLLGFLFVFLTYAASFATFPAFFSLAFPTNVRYTGAAVSVNIGAALGGSLAPLLSAALFEATGSWVSIAIYISAVSALSVIAGIFLRELPDPAPAPVPSARPAAAHPGER
ncbi:MFS transporter [Amycolatopsis sp. Poz14]|uniref:MFS transporter n=1 Tax=Amycolatopsis sp. Poz14 TaxID=1447705 RepID=UPI001EE9871C|nr:MFS transporter [Amycolatopsis sp. Poz14]MCG3753898.1 MHS family MFS transporter [Amycolatopsis sp. Poz14]